MSSLGGSTNIKTQINNLWGAIRTLNNTGSDVDLTNYVPKNASSTITGNLTCDSFIKSGGTNIQYLMADGSALTYSSNSGNSNYYLFLNGTDGTTTPADGYITYNQNPFQFQSTMIYISHLTSDGLDIEVFFKQLTTLSEVYIQDKSNARFMQFNITGTPTITTGQNIAIPVMIRTNSTSGLGQGRQLMISFFTNSLEVDSRLSNLETNTQNQSVISGATTFSGDVLSDAFKVNGQTGFLMADGNIDNNIYLTSVSLTNAGTGQSLVVSGSGSSLSNKSLTAGTNITFTPTTNDIVINASGLLPLVGGVSLTGQVSTNQTPALPAHLVPKSYVDTFLPKAGGTMTGPITMGTNVITTTLPTASFTGTNLVSKNYSDATYLRCINEPIKIVRGVVYANGTVAGTTYGITSSINGVGTITITFTGNPFSTYASIVASPLYSGNTVTSAIISINATNQTPQTCQIICYNGTTQAISGIHFIAIG